MLAHIIQGKKGCIFGKDTNLGIVIVDALRASATACMLFHHGATRIYAVSEIDTALNLKKLFPHALLFGERYGLPPQGFDHGNSPREAKYAKGKEVIFTTTTGARLLFEAYSKNSPFLIMATTLNAYATAQFLKKHNKDFVIVPAGLFDDTKFSAQEDWVSACFILHHLEVKIVHGNQEYEYWTKRIKREGIEELFNTAPHAEKLRQIHLHEDIRWCAQTNITNSIPMAVDKEKNYVIMDNTDIL